MENFNLKGYLKENKLNEETFQYDPSIDYLAEYELLPQNIQDILLKYADEIEFGDLDMRKKMVDELEANGWTVDCDFSPDGLFSLRPIDATDWYGKED